MAADEGSPTRPRGIKALLNKARNPSNDDQAGIAARDDNDSRNSLESFADRLKRGIQKTGDSSDPADDASTHSGEGKLGKIQAMSKRISEKIKMKKSNAGLSDVASSVDSEEWRGRQLGSATSLNSDGHASAVGSGLGIEMSGRTDQVEASSILTSASEDEATESPSRPPLLGQEARAPYFKATTPEVTATQLTGGSQAPVSVPTTHVTRPSGEYTNSNLQPLHALQHGWTMDAPSRRKTLAIDGQGAARSKSRSISPRARVKNVFKRQKAHAEREASQSPERPSTSPVRPSQDGTRPGTSDGLPATPSRPGASTMSLPAAQTWHTSGFTNGSLSNKPSLSSIIIDPGMPGKSPALTATPPTPVIGSDDLLVKSPTHRPRKGSVEGPPPAILNHRRSRSDSASKNPSKLSQSMNPPLTPMIEEPRGTSSRSASGATTGTGGGFFSSVLNATQNAVTSFTNITGSGNRPRTAATLSQSDESEETSQAEITRQQAVNQPKLAIETLGNGDLSLSHLGIADSPSSINTPSSDMRSRSGTITRHEEASAQAENVAAGRAVSAAYEEKSPIDQPPVAEDASSRSVRPNSMYDDNATQGMQTPPNGSIHDGENDRNGVGRTNSLRQKIGGRKRKQRNSSATTIGAAIAASHASFGSPTRGGTVNPASGTANKKRDNDFHQLFRSVPEDDHLVEDYSCALQREIILAGRIYVCEGHICFSSNILGWVTTLVISFEEVVAVEKENTAMVFPNAIAVQTLHARHTFRSLLQREGTYDLIIQMWKVSHPGLQSYEHGTKLVSVDAAGAKGSSDDEDESSGDDDENESDDGDDDHEDERSGAAVRSRSTSIALANEPITPGQPLAATTGARRTSAMMGQEAGAATSNGPTLGDGRAASSAAAAAASAARDFPGPANHAPTECTDQSTHYENLLKDDTVPAPLGKVYQMVFGSSSGGFMSRWLMDEVKCWEMQLSHSTVSLDEAHKSRTYTYMKPLGNSLGPRQTKCVVTEQLDHIDLEKSVSVTVTTQTPDVPSGNIFSTKTRYCLMWGPNGSTRIIMSFTIEWTGKSWLKGPIEKGAKDGQTTYADDLVKALRAGVSSRIRAGSKSKKGKKKRDKDGMRSASNGTLSGSTKSKDRQRSAWGILEPVRGIFGPVMEPVVPLFTVRSLCGLLLFLLVVSWFRNSRFRVVNKGAQTPVGVPLSASSSPRGWLGRPKRSAGVDIAGIGRYPMATAYEDLWREEESLLWEWLEERTGLREGIAFGGDGERGNADDSMRARERRQKVLEGAGSERNDKLAQEVEGMGRREVEHAIRLTEEKLRRLRRVVDGQKGDE